MCDFSLSQFLTSMLLHFAKPGHLALTLGRTQNSLLKCYIFVDWAINILTRNLYDYFGITRCGRFGPREI